MGRFQESRQALQPGSEDYQAPVSQATGVRELSGVHRHAQPLDRSIAGLLLAGLSPKDSAGDGRLLENWRMAGVRRRWQSRQRAAHAAERRALFAQVETLARSAEASPPEAQETPEKT